MGKKVLMALFIWKMKKRQTWHEKLLKRSFLNHLAIKKCFIPYCNVRKVFENKINNFVSFPRNLIKKLQL